MGARSSSTPLSNRLAIFFDGGCRVCAWEVEKYLALDRNQKLSTIDINAPGFQATEYGLSAEQVRKYFHVLTPEGKVIAGVDAFIEIWKTLGSPLSLLASRWAKFPPVHLALRAGYRVFVEIRPYLPRKDIPACHDGSCEIKKGIL